MAYGKAAGGSPWGLGAMGAGTPGAEATQEFAAPMRQRLYATGLRNYASNPFAGQPTNPRTGPMAPHLSEPAPTDPFLENYYAYQPGARARLDRIYRTGGPGAYERAVSGLLGGMGREDRLKWVSTPDPGFSEDNMGIAIEDPNNPQWSD